MITGSPHSPRLDRFGVAAAACVLMLSAVIPRANLTAAPGESEGFKPGGDYPADWSDLKREPSYGSLKEERYTVDALIVAEENWEDHYHLGILGFYQYTDYPNFTRTRVLPFFSSLRAKHDPRNSGWFLPLYYYENSADESFWLTPLSLSTKDSKSSFLHLGYLYNRSQEHTAISYRVWPLLFWHTDPERADYSLTILPLLHYAAAPEENILVTPLGYTSRETYQDRTENTTLLGPVMWSTESRMTEDDAGQAHHESRLRRAHLWPLAWSGTDYGRESEQDRWWFYSLLVPMGISAGENEISVISLLGYYDSWQSSTAEREASGRSILLPGYFQSTASTRSQGDPGPDKQNVQNNTDSAQFINPLFYYSDRVERTGTQIEYSTSFWVPILPLYYQFDDSQSGQRRLIANTTWTRDTDGALTSAWFVPFAFYQPGSKGYLHIAPFYFQPIQNDDREWMSFSPLHYYHSENQETPAERTTLWAGPFYRSEDRGAETYYGHLAPLYFSWDTPESEFHLALPAYVQYEDASRLIHVNAAGISFSTERLPLPVVGRGETGTEWVIDQDIALFYNLFRFSTRVALTDAGSELDSDATNETEVAGILKEPIGESDGPGKDPGQGGERFNRGPGPDGAPGLTRSSRNPDRDTARNFLGVESLFGLLAYERSDNWRHFRMLPLSWFSWDATTEDRVYVIPAGFLSYASHDLEYFALFPALIPLYGHQRDGESFVESYLALAYLREYDADSQTREHSVLWPLSNFYESPHRHGGRILPFFWYRSQEMEGADPEDENPRTTQLQNTATRETTAIAPLFYYHATGLRNTHWLAPLYYATTDIATNNAPDSEGNTIGETGTHLERTLLALPGIYYRRQVIQGPDAATETTGDYTLHIPGYIQTSEDTWITHNILYGLFWNRSSQLQSQDPANSGEHTVALWGLVSRSNEPGDQSLWVLPFYYSGTDESEDYSNTTRISPLFYYEQSQWEDEAPHSTVVLPPLLTYWNSYEETTTILGPGFYRTASETHSHTNLLLLADWKHSAANGLQRAWLFPLAGWRSGDTEYEREPGESYYYLAPIWYGHDPYQNETALHILPLFWSWYKTDPAPDEYSGTYFVAGLYISTTPGYHRENFLYLYDRIYQSEEQRHNLELAFGLFGVETRPQSFELSLGYGWLAGTSFNQENFDANLLWLQHESHQASASWHNSFWPVWWLDSSPDEFFWVATPLLSLGSREADSGYQFIGAGILWHRYYDRSQNDASSRLLLGALYEDLRRPERGYHTRGSLWGYLWQYQEETETDYRKFSVLKFLYSRTENDGQVRHRVLGLKVAET